MNALITFINNTSYPVISIYSDNKLISDNILKKSSSKKFPFKQGSIDFEIKENHEKTFQNLWISINDDTEYNLIIENLKTFLKEV